MRFRHSPPGATSHHQVLIGTSNSNRNIFLQAKCSSQVPKVYSTRIYPRHCSLLVTQVLSRNMSHPDLNVPSPEDERSDYAPSESSEDDVSDSDGDGLGDEPAFDHISALAPIARNLNHRAAGDEFSRPVIPLSISNGMYYKFIPWFTTPEVELGTTRRPALLPVDNNPSMYARYVLHQVFRIR